jgi:hypothetical protein
MIFHHPLDVQILNGDVLEDDGLPVRSVTTPVTLEQR